MIKVIETPATKVVGETSFRLIFNYNKELIEVLHRIGNCIWLKAEKVWEMPINKLAEFIDNAALIDDIEVTLMEDAPTETVQLLCNYKTKPYSYQEQGIKWIIEKHNGLLLDEPGLGKTIQLIYAAEELKKQKGAQHCLIICGINSLKTNWRNEIKKHSNESCVIIGERINSKGKVTYATIKERAEQLKEPIEQFFVIMNCEMLVDPIVVDAIKNSKNKFDIIAIDEAHKVAGPTSTRGKNLLKLASVGDYHIAMTGTLIMNSPIDSFIPLKFIGANKSTLTSYKQMYCVMDQRWHNQVIGYKNLDLLKNEIDGHSLRRLKSEVLDLPPKTIIKECIEMEPEHRKLYDDLVQGISEEFDLVHIDTSALLGLVIRERQATACPGLLSSKDVPPSKLLRAVDLAEEIISTGNKVVIFSQFKAPVEYLMEHLAKYGAVCATGDTSVQDTDNAKDRFQNDPNCKVFIGTLDKIGTGFTLTAASYEIFIDQPWTAAVDGQCEDRCYRIGTSKPLTIYKLICTGTIDERVFNKVAEKKDLADYLVDDIVNNRETLLNLLGVDNTN